MLKCLNFPFHIIFNSCIITKIIEKCQVFKGLSSYYDFSSKVLIECTFLCKPLF